MICKAELLDTFQGYQVCIDRVNDKHERLVKLSRDITVESKRLIFQLHRIDFSGEQFIKPDIEQKLIKIKFQWRRLAKELSGESPHRFLRAYSPGLQEYIEAVTLEYYLRTNKLMSLHQVQESLCFGDEVKAKNEKDESKNQSETRTTTTTTTEPQTTTPSPQIEPQFTTKPHTQPQATTSTELQVHIPLQEYLLGVADMTGEVMRVVVRQMGKVPYENFAAICEFVRLLCDNFESLGWVDKTFNKKMSVMRQSLSKVETALYTYKLRGSEIPSGCLLLPPSFPHASFGCSDDADNDFQ